MYIPWLLWDIMQSSVIVSPYLENLPSTDAIIQSPTFRRLGNGQVYQVYKHIAWGSRVVWDAPVVAYHYLLYVVCCVG